MAKEGRDSKGKFTKGNLFSLGLSNSGRPNTTGLPSVKDVGKKEYDRLYIKWRRKHDKEFAINSKISRLVRGVFKNKSTTGKGVYYLGIDGIRYRDYLKKLFDNKMTWDNYGTYWEIDHIKPKSSFNLLDNEEVKKCFHYKNTRPLPIDKNRKKSNKFTPEQKTLFN